MKVKGQSVKLGVPTTETKMSEFSYSHFIDPSLEQFDNLYGQVPNEKVVRHILFLLPQKKPRTRATEGF